MNQTTTKIAQFWSTMQGYLFPRLEEELGPLSPSHHKVVQVLELVRIEEFIPCSKGMPWRPAMDRAAIARAFVAKAALNLPTTRALLDRLACDARLRRICGWESEGAIPNESKFSRAFGLFAEIGLVNRVHKALITEYHRERVVGPILRDASAIVAREKPVDRPAKDDSRPKRKRGRPKKGEAVAAQPPTRLERQVDMTLEQMLAELPKCCDRGCKRNSKSSVEYWVGYKLHLDVSDAHLPLSAVLTSASVHDSQAALPLALLSTQRVDNLYDLMDGAYDSKIIREYSRQLGHVPIIPRNFKGSKQAKQEHLAECRRLDVLHMTMPEDERFKERTAVERVFSRLKDEFGGRYVRVRGHAKVLAHLMFGLLALTADQLTRLVPG
jgi:hypothetical protein